MTTTYRSSVHSFEPPAFSDCQTALHNPLSACLSAVKSLDGRVMSSLFHRLLDFGMLDGEGGALLREIEHVEDDGLVARVHAAVDGTDHLDDCIASADNLPFAIKPDNRQFALLQDAVVDDGMMVPRQLASDREDVAHDNEFRLPLEVVGKSGAVPALGGALEFQLLDGGDAVVLRERRRRAAALAAGLATGKDGDAQDRQKNGQCAFHDCCSFFSGYFWGKGL